MCLASKWGSLFIALGLGFSGAVAKANNQTEKAGTELRQSSQAVQPAPANRWAMNLTSGRFDFVGTEAARSNSYSFDRILVESQSVGVTYKQTNQLSFAANGKYLQNYSELRAGGKLFKSQTEGWGDTMLSSTYVEPIDAQQTLISTVGVQVPTGSVTIKNPRKVNVNQAYYLQTGSGTYDVYGSMVYMKSWNQPLRSGAMASALVRTGRNEEDYRRGSEYSAAMWTDWTLSSYFTPGVKLNYKHIGKLAGVDQSLGRNLYTEYYHAPQNNWDLGFTLKGSVPIKTLGNTSFSYAAGIPVFQRLKNIVNLQVDTKYIVTAGLQTAF
ncbi:MAG: hypothetical protein H6624_15220 [Bdellovibrionaceae bacterium]|nr:hypothetical protein [Bdellovibrionales bacterium]MCB9085696.1 hypothetical protein [Pseudobdellovibrionaceae bacterium]